MNHRAGAEPVNRNLAKVAGVIFCAQLTISFLVGIWHSTAATAPAVAGTYGGLVAAALYAFVAWQISGPNNFDSRFFKFLPKSNKSRARGISFGMLLALYSVPGFFILIAQPPFYVASVTLVSLMSLGFAASAGLDVNLEYEIVSQKAARVLFVLVGLGGLVTVSYYRTEGNAFYLLWVFMFATVVLVYFGWVLIVRIGIWYLAWRIEPGRAIPVWRYAVLGLTFSIALYAVANIGFEPNAMGIIGSLLAGMGATYLTARLALTKVSF